MKWQQRFDKQFPYAGAIIEDDGRSYTLADIKQFFTDVIEKQLADQKGHEIYEMRKLVKDSFDELNQKMHLLQTSKDYLYHGNKPTQFVSENK